MSISSPSRRRLLRWATGASLLGEGLAAGILESLPGFQRRDPRIRTLTYRQTDPIELTERSIAVTPFPAPQGGQPPAPDFAPYLRRSLRRSFPKSTVESLATPDIEVLVRGRVELFHRVGARGLRVHVSAELYDVSAEGELVLWAGAKKADWIRRFPTDDCLQLLADSFIETWMKG